MMLANKHHVNHPYTYFFYNLASSAVFVAENVKDMVFATHFLVVLLNDGTLQHFSIRDWSMVSKKELVILHLIFELIHRMSHVFTQTQVAVRR